MKKGILVGLGVVALLTLMWWADKKFPAGGVRSPITTSAPTDAPTVAFKDLNDKDVTLAQFKGQVVLVNFWATWCAPCKVEIPWMIEFQKKYGRNVYEKNICIDHCGERAWSRGTSEGTQL